MKDKPNQGKPAHGKPTDAGGQWPTTHVHQKPPLMPGRRCTWRSYLTAYEAHQIAECRTGRYRVHVGSQVYKWLSSLTGCDGNTWGREIGGVWEADNGLWSILGTPLDEAIGAAEGDAPIPGERPICDCGETRGTYYTPQPILDRMLRQVRDDDGQPEPPAGPMDSDLTMGGPDQ